MTRRLCVLAALIVGALALLVPPALADGPKNKDNDTHVQLLAINDLHGNLQPPTGSGGRISVGVGQTVDAGGVEYLATWIKQLHERNSHPFFVGAGDQF